jgi:hypothetical protein
MLVELIKLTTPVRRANNPAPGSDPIALQATVEVLAGKLAALNPTPEPALSPLINARWVLLYTGPSRKLALSAFAALSGGPNSASEAAGPTQQQQLQVLLDAAYRFFYRFFPLIAGSAVGRARFASGQQATNVQVSCLVSICACSSHGSVDAYHCIKYNWQVDGHG